MNRGQYFRLGFCFPSQPSHKSTFYVTKRKTKNKHKNSYSYPRQKLKTKQKKVGTMPLGSPAYQCNHMRVQSLFRNSHNKKAVANNLSKLSEVTRAYLTSFQVF